MNSKKFPNKEQAVIIEAILNVSKHEYAYKIEKLIGPREVRFNKVGRNPMDKDKVTDISDSEVTDSSNSDFY